MGVAARSARHPSVRRARNRLSPRAGARLGLRPQPPSIYTRCACCSREIGIRCPASPPRQRAEVSPRYSRYYHIRRSGSSSFSRRGRDFLQVGDQRPAIGGGWLGLSEACPSRARNRVIRASGTLRWGMLRVAPATRMVTFIYLRSPWRVTFWALARLALRDKPWRPQPGCERAS